MWSKPADLARIIGDVATTRRRRLGDRDAARRRDRPPRLGDGAADRRLRGAHARAARDAGAGHVRLDPETFRHLVGTDGWYLTFFRDGPRAIEEDAEPMRTWPTCGRRSPRTARPGWRSSPANPDGETDMVEHGDGWDFHSPLGSGSRR